MTINENFDTATHSAMLGHLHNQLTSHGYNPPLRNGASEIYSHESKPTIHIDHNAKTVSVIGKHTSSINSIYSPHVRDLISDSIVKEHRANELHNMNTETDPSKIHQMAVNSSHNIRTAEELIHGLRKKQSAMPSAEQQNDIQKFTEIRDHHRSVLDALTNNKHANAESLDIAAKHGLMITHRRKANPDTIHKQVAHALSNDEYSLHAAAALSNSTTPKKTLDLISSHPYFANKVQDHPNWR